MVMQNQIYKTDNRISNCISKIEESELSENNIQALKQFKTELLARGLSEHRVNAIMQSFSTISHLIDFDLKEASRTQAMELVTEINQDNIRDDKNYSIWSLCEYKKAIKKFYQWDRGEQRPEVIDFINVHPKESEKPRIDPDELIDVDEAEEIINNCCNSRDKALFGMLWDSGARIGELLALKWKDLEFKQDLMGVKIRNGKNGQRKIYLVECIPLIQQWKKDYPGRARPEDPVWIALRSGGRKEKRQMTYRAAAKQLREYSNDIDDRKKTNPHAWRKARATDLASKGMSQPNMNAFFGWVAGSEISKFYIRLAQRDVERAVRRIYPGLQDLEDKDDGQEFLGENLPEYNETDLRRFYGETL